MSDRDLPVDRLATTDSTGKRIYLFPADVRGRFKNSKFFVHSFLMLLFLVLPWVRIRGTQALLLDVAHRKFSIFGVLFWAHDAPLIGLILGTVALSIIAITAIWGRIWCGWACPQTVFIESVFRKVERFLIGDHIAQKLFSEAPWSLDKFSKTIAKWICFVVFSLIISHSFLAYFVGTDALAQMILSSPTENPGAFGVMLFVFTLVLFDFGWFREQFCIIACPYGRFQSVLMDDRSLAILYDQKRGEPRRGIAETKEKQGDCVNCYRCVAVCPTGIDIRRGVQLECIACTSCIDACDEIMDNLERPRGLIRYDSIQKGKSIRGFLYFALLFAVMVALGFFVKTREPVSIDIVRALESPYRDTTEGRVVNHFKVDIENQTFEHINVDVLTDSHLYSIPDVRFVFQAGQLRFEGGEHRHGDLFIEFPKKALTLGKGKLTIQFKGSRSGYPDLIFKREIPLVGPFI